MQTPLQGRSPAALFMGCASLGPAQVSLAMPEHPPGLWDLRAIHTVLAGTLGQCVVSLGCPLCKCRKMNLWAITGFWLGCGAAVSVERKACCGRGVLWCTIWKFWWVWRGECPGALLDLADGLSPKSDRRDGFPHGSVCLWCICSARLVCGFVF